MTPRAVDLAHGSGVTVHGGGFGSEAGSGLTGGLRKGPADGLWFSIF